MVVSLAGKHAPVLLMAALAVSLGLAGNADAQQLNCLCMTPVLEGSSVQGTIASAEGGVVVTKPAGLRPASVGDALTAGSRIVVGPQGSASIYVGADCEADLAPNSDVTLPQIGNQLCVRVRQAIVVRPAGQQSGSALGPTRGLKASQSDAVPIALGGLGVLGAGIGLAVAISGNGSVSP